MSDETTPPPSGWGYKNPPVHGRFKKGCSGNPNGRPKGSKGKDTLWKEELNSTVTLKVNGKEKKISKLDLLIRQTVKRASDGNVQCKKIVFEEAERIQQKERQVSTPSTESQIGMDIPTGPVTDDERLDLFAKFFDGVKARLEEEARYKLLEETKSLDNPNIPEKG